MKEHDMPHTYSNIFLLVFILPLSLSQICCNKASSVNGSGYSNLTSTFIPPSESVSFCVWLAAAKGQPFHLLSYFDTYNKVQIRITTDKVSFRGTVISENQWFKSNNISNHLCLTWDVAKGVNLYLNGSEIQHINSSLIPSNELSLNGQWFLGANVTINADNKTEFSRGLEGVICGMTIWAKYLSSPSINRLFVSSEGDGYNSEEENGADDPQIKIFEPIYKWEDFSHSGYEGVDETYCKSDERHGIKLGNLDPVASKFVILFLVIVGVIIGFAGLFFCSEREIAAKHANKSIKTENHLSIEDDESLA